jgi:hypothetical protein
LIHHARFRVRAAVLVGAAEQRKREGDAKRVFGGLYVDD